MKPKGKYIKGFGKRYIITRHGNIWVYSRGVWYKKKTYKAHGYILAKISYKGNRIAKYIHRLVAEYFIPNPMNLPEVDHIDCDPGNNDYRNLQWVTVQDNRKLTWLRGRGRNNKGSGLPVQQLGKDGGVVREFSSAFVAGRELGIRHQNIWAVCNYRQNTAGGYGWRYKR